MKISVPCNKQGYLLDAYGKYADLGNVSAGNTILSFPITISDVPENAKSLAIAFYDYDSIPVCGFAWIHWIACDINPATTYIPENASQSGEFSFIQGTNSVYSRYQETVDEVGFEQAQAIVQGYIGPCPPDANHCYTLEVHALDTVLGLQPGFFANELHWALNKHSIDMAKIDFMSRA